MRLCDLATRSLGRRSQTGLTGVFARAALKLLLSLLLGIYKMAGPKGRCGMISKARDGAMKVNQEKSERFGQLCIQQLHKTLKNTKAQSKDNLRAQGEMGLVIKSPKRKQQEEMATYPEKTRQLSCQRRFLTNR